MKSHSAIHTRTVLTTVCALAFALGMTAVRARADEWDKKTVLTLNQPVQVTDTVLQPGQYTFRLLDAANDRHVVQIFDKNQMHLITSVMAIPAWRNDVTSDSKFTFWETPAGSAKALRDWYYPGDNVGQEFPYPKNLKTIETASAAAPPAPPAPTPATAPAPTPAVAPPPAPTPEPTPTTQPADMTNDTTPAPTPAATPQTPQSTPTPPDSTDSTPSKLPKTASPFPLIGLIGLSSLAAFSLLRTKKRSA